MNKQPAEPFTGMTVQAVAEATGLSRGEIYRVAGILDLGGPAHFRYVDSVLVYTPAGLCQLAEGMDLCGHDLPSKALRAVLEKHRSQIVEAIVKAPAVDAPAAPVPEPVGGLGWLKRWQDGQEGAA